MKRILQLLLLAVTLLACGVIAEAQQQSKLFKIGEITFRTRSTLGTGRELLRREFRELGYAEGKNIAYESRSAEGKLERFPALAKELVDLKVDVLLASGINEALAFKAATKTIPIVFLISSDPLADGLVDAMGRAGGNITGVTSFTATLAGKRLELLKETVPKLSRVAVLWNPQDPSSARQWEENQLPGRELGLELHSIEVISVDKFEDAFYQAKKAQCAALTVMAGSLATSNPKLIVDLAVKYRLPALYHRQSYAENGGLMSYGPDETEPYKRIAAMIEKIFKGEKPGDIPVEQPRKFDLIVNLKAAQQINFSVPPNVLMRATKVIK